MNQLPDGEAARLAQMIVARLGGLDVEVPEIEAVRSLPPEQLGAVLRAISDRLLGR